MLARLCFFVWCLAAALGVTGVRAEPVDSTTTPLDSVYTIPEIVVEAPRVPLHVDDVYMRPGFVAVVDLRPREGRVEDLSDVLSRMVGVRVRQYGGLGSFATASIRGSSSNQVEVYLDGVPLNDGYSGVTNLADLPLDGVERIEVFRGFAPPQLGSSSIGGAINLVTRGAADVTRHPGFELRESRGSYRTARHVMSWWSDAGPANVFLHAGYMKSDGNFTFVHDRGTPQNPDDEVETTRINNDFDQWNLLGRLNLSAGGAGEFTLGHNSFVREQGVPGIGSDQSESARAERERHLTYVRWALPAVLGERLQTFVRGYHSASNEKLHDPDGDIALYATDTDNDFRVTGGTARVKFEVPRVPAALEALYEGRYEAFTPRDHLPRFSEGPDRTRMTHQGALSVDLYLFRQDLVLTATQRFITQATEFYDAPAFPYLPPSPQGRRTFDEATPQFGFRWHPASFVTVKGNWGRYVRQPTMLELFGNVGSVTGSDDLVPEHGTNRDIGVVFSYEGASALRSGFGEIVYLYNDVGELILFFPNSQYTSRPENISSARIRGWEVSFSTRWNDWLRVAGNYAYLDSRDTGPIPYYNGNALPSRPKYDATLFVDTMWRRWTLSYELHYIGANYLNPANFDEVPAREIHNLALRVRMFSDALSFTAGAANLGDNRISDVSGFPLPGRSFYATLGFQL